MAFLFFSERLPKMRLYQLTAQLSKLSLVPSLLTMFLPLGLYPLVFIGETRSTSLGLVVVLEDLGRQLQDGLCAVQDASVGAVGEVEVEEAVRDGRFQEQVRLRLRAMLEPVQIDDLENGLFDVCRYRYTVLSRGHGWVRWVRGRGWMDRRKLEQSNLHTGIRRERLEE